MLSATREEEPDQGAVEAVDKEEPDRSELAAAAAVERENCGGVHRISTSSSSGGASVVASRVLCCSGASALCCCCCCSFHSCKCKNVGTNLCSNFTALR